MMQSIQKKSHLRKKTLVTMLSLCPLELLQEISRYLHSCYFSVVLEELVLMTSEIPIYLAVDESHLSAHRRIKPVPCITHGRIIVPRWSCVHWLATDFDNIFVLKQQLQEKDSIEDDLILLPLLSADFPKLLNNS